MNFQGKPKKYLLKTLKVTGWISLSVFGLLVLISLAIQIPYVQNRLVQKAVGFLQNKIGTDVSLKHISLSVPKKIVLTGLYLEDQKKDTLLYAGEIEINTDLWGLTKRTIQLNDVGLSDFSAFISRNDGDSTFNFDYILKAFAGDTTVIADTTQAPWNFSIGDVSLNDIRISFNDALMGNAIALELGTLDVSAEQFDLETSTVKVDEISLENVKADILQTKVAEDTVEVVSDSTAQPIAFDIGVNAIDLKDIEVKYNHDLTGQVIVLTLGELLVETDAMDLKNRVINLDKVSLHNTFVSIHQKSGYKPASHGGDTLASPKASDTWHMSLRELDLSNNSLQYHDFNQPFQKGVFDVNHLWIAGLNTKANDLAWQGSQFRGNLSSLSLRDRSGFSIESCSGLFALTDNSATAKDLKFTSPNSNLAIDAKIDFNSLETISNTYPDMSVNLNVQKTVIGVRDILFFVPTLFEGSPLNVPENATVSLDTKIKGPLKDLMLERFNLQTLRGTTIDVHGNIQIRKEEDPYLDVELRKFYTTSNDMTTLLPDTLIPSSITLPEWLNLSGKLKGTIGSPNVQCILTSDLGHISLDADLGKAKNSETLKYSGDLKITEFNAGKLLKQEENIGPVTLTATVDGSGLKMDELDTKLNLHVISFLYNGYNYRDFILNGTLQKYFFEGTAALNDQNLSMKLDGGLNFNKEIPEYHFSFELKNADFKALNFSERPLKARGTLEVDLATADFKIINGDLNIRKVAIFNGSDLYAVDSLLFASIDQKGQSEISIRSDIIDGNFKGTINLYSLPEVIQRHFNNYFSLQDTVYEKPAQPQNFNFALKIKNTDLITEILIPELDPFVPGVIEGAFDSNSDQLDMKINLADFRYSGIGADSITFDVTSDKEALSYTLALRKILMDTLRMEALKLEGNVANDSIRTKLVILDSLQRNKYVWGGVFHSLEKVFQFRFLPNEVVMNYAPWATPPDNSLQFTSKGILANNFSITNINESIALKTSNDQDSIVSIVFKDLNLQNITKLVEGTTPLDGLANGDLSMMSSEKGAFNSNLQIDDLTILDHVWGNLSVALGQTASGPLNIDVRLESEHTSLKAAGYYIKNPSAPEINFAANIEKFDLANIGVLTGGQLKNTKGALKGGFRITGNPSQPDVEGEINFSNASFTPSLVNSEFTLENETIRVEDEDIILSNFEIKDRQNNKAKLDGTIKSEAFTNFALNLKLTASNFQILNSTEKDNDLFYGKVGVSTTTSITGNFSEPVVDMHVNLTDESNFTYVIPQSEKGVLEQKGIVEFVDRDAKDDPFLATINPKDTLKSTFKGINLSANIELNDKETFNIIIDPATGDKLSVKGNSTLTLDIDPTGDMVLTGRYEISEGSYDLSFYKLVKRKFLIEKGSSIIWAGNPIDATMDISAIYEVETSPIELISNETTDAQELNTYKQRLPFLVYLHIKGQLMTPEISFQLDMAEADRNAFGGVVYAKLRDINTRESDLNKQVFALLILKRFISDNPLDNKAGSDVASTARRSVSKLLSEQLNRLSENIEGVELSFDVKSYEDYSTGSAEGQTEVQLGLSKSLLNDRLIVKVSGNFEVEGETSDQNSASDYIGDLALEYKLTEDGRFRITGFRNTNFDMINGELLETGVGLIYIKDYNTLRELFKANAKEN